MGELGRFKEETGFRTRGIVPGSEGCEPEVSKVSVFDGFRGVYIESIILYFERIPLYFESMFLYFERILLYFESMFLYFERILLYFESIFLYFESIVFVL